MGRWWLFAAFDAECQERANGTRLENGFQPGRNICGESWFHQPEVTKTQILRQPQQPVLLYDHVLEPILPLPIALEDFVTIHGQRVPTTRLFLLRLHTH